MTRKDYQAAADIVQKRRSEGTSEVSLTVLVDAFVALFKRHENFNEARFRKACEKA